MDGHVDPARIARAAKAFCDPDVCCFQEVAINYPDLDGSRARTSPRCCARALARLQRAFRAGGRRARRQGRPAPAFGNLILSRLPVRQVFRHTLPWPPEAGVPNMPRVAIEAVVEALVGPGERVHHAPRVLLERAARRAGRAPVRTAGRSASRIRAAPCRRRTRSGPFAAVRAAGRRRSSRATSTCARRIRSMATLHGNWRDAWRARASGQARTRRPSACSTNEFAQRALLLRLRVRERRTWRRASRRCASICETQASDHQPVIVEFRP